MSRPKFWIRRAVLLSVATTCLIPLARGGTGDVGLDGLIAERMALIADEISAAPEIPTAVLHQSAALLDIARDFNPNELRFARSSADILLRLGDRDRAIDALAAIRKIAPGDQVAMIQFIDLNTSKMETAEQKVAYLKQVIDARGVATEVQSHAAIQLMDLYYARSQDPEAAEMLKLALKLNPQNIPALQAKYRIAASSGVARDRVSALADLLRATPTDVDAMSAMAHEADALGSYDNAGMFRVMALQINSMRGIPPRVEEAIDFVGTQLLAGNAQAAEQVIGQLLGGLKEDGRGYTLALLDQQLQGATPAEDTIPMARGVYLAQLAGVSQMLNNPDKTEMPTTNPAVPMPNVRADVAKLKAADPKNLSVAYAVALTEQLWFDLYFKAAEVDDANVEALASLLGENDPIVVRFQGWKLLAAGKFDEARLKLEAVADRDGFARLGMIMADSGAGKTDKAREEMTEMVRQRPTGMIAAYSAVAAKQMQVVADQTAPEQAISDIITSVRRFVGEVLNNPRGSYLLTAQPTQVSYAAGEPIVAVVTLLNNGQTPVTVGPGGLIEPEFIVDAQIREAEPHGFPAIARGRWTGVIRLKPSQKITQTIRVDRGQLFGYLRQFPTPLFPMTAYVLTNAVPDPNIKGLFVAGPGGQQTKLGKAFERQSAPLYTEEFRNKVLQQLANGSASQRTAMAELFGTLIGPLKTQTQNADALAMAKSLSDALTAQTEKETNPEIKVWMQLSSKEGVSDDEWMKQLATSNTVLGQVGAMLAARVQPKEKRQAIAQVILAANPLPSVAEFANALAVQPDLIPPEPKEPAGE